MSAISTRRLRAILDGLLANVELATDGSPVMSGRISDPRFTIPLSGWYWQVSPPKDKTLRDLASESSLEKRLVPTEADLQTRERGGVASFYIKDSNGTQLRAIEQKFKLFGGEEFSFLVAGNFDELKDEIPAFQRALYGVLALLGFGLLARHFPAGARRHEAHAAHAASPEHHPRRQGRAPGRGVSQRNAARGR